MEGTASFLYGMYGILWIERYLCRVQNMIHDWLQGNVEKHCKLIYATPSILLGSAPSSIFVSMDCERECVKKSDVWLSDCCCMVQQQQRQQEESVVGVVVVVVVVVIVKK